MSTSSLDASLTIFPLNSLAFFSIHAGTGLEAFTSTFSLTIVLSFFVSLTLIISPGFTKYDGMLTFLPLTSNKPWFTKSLACGLDEQ